LKQGRPNSKRWNTSKRRLPAATMYERNFSPMLHHSQILLAAI